MSEPANFNSDQNERAGWSVCRDCGDHLGPGCVAIVIDGEAVCFECAPLASDEEEAR